MKPNKKARAGKQSDPFEIKIDKLIYGGYGLGHYHGKAVFVPFSAPGDRLFVRAVEEKKNLTRAAVVHSLGAGPGRVEPLCRYFGSCGGCQWQHLEYSRQVDAKRRILEEIFYHRFPKTRDLLISMKASVQDYGYRSRARLQLRGSGSEARIGFFRFQSHAIEDIDFCPLLRPTLNMALASIRRDRRKEVTDSAALQMEIACVEETKSWEAVQAEAMLCEGLSAAAGRHKARDAPVLQRRVGEYIYTISPATFFQANDFMLTELVTAVLNLAKGAGTRSALDLFSGVGLFTLPLARRFENVVGVDNSPLACALAERNARAASFHNTRFTCADVSAWMQASSSVAHPAPDLILLDPPRIGAGAEVINRISEWAPETIIYVSCNPQTLSRDVALLPAREYEIDFIEGLDLFPQTYHFETILRLRRV